MQSVHVCGGMNIVICNVWGWGRRRSLAFAILSITYELKMLELKETLEAILNDFPISLLLHLKIRLTCDSPGSSVVKTPLFQCKG